MRLALALLGFMALLGSAQAQVQLPVGPVELPATPLDPTLEEAGVRAPALLVEQVALTVPSEVSACLCLALDGIALLPASAQPAALPVPEAGRADAPNPFLPTLPNLAVGGGLFAALLAGAAALTAPKTLRRVLAAGAGLGLFSRIEGPRLLEQPVRATLWGFIQANPGASAREAQLAAGVAWGTALGHLRRLESAGLLVSHRHAGQRGYWVATAPEARSRSAHAALKDAQARALAGAVLARPGAAQADLAGLAKLPAYAASRHLRRLGEAGLVAALRTGRTVRYTPGPTLGAFLASLTAANPTGGLFTPPGAAVAVAA